MRQLDNHYFIYYILLENNKYYVTSYKTNKYTIQDFISSISFCSPDWLLINRPIRILKIKQRDFRYQMEDYIIDFMRQQGMYSVRGDGMKEAFLSKYMELCIREKMGKICIPCDYIEEENDLDSLQYSDSDSDRFSSQDFIMKKPSMMFRFLSWIHKCCKKEKQHVLLDEC